MIMLGPPGYWSQTSGFDNRERSPAGDPLHQVRERDRLRARRGARERRPRSRAARLARSGAARLSHERVESDTRPVAGPTTQEILDAVGEPAEILRVSTD